MDILYQVNIKIVTFRPLSKAQLNTFTVYEKEKL
jgi:hypothetical protein